MKGYHEQRHRSLAHRLASLVNETDCGEKKEKKNQGSWRMPGSFKSRLPPPSTYLSSYPGREHTPIIPPVPVPMPMLACSLPPSPHVPN